MVRSKIFFGCNSASSIFKSADRELNDWLEDNEKHIKITNVQYQQARMGDHSIFVLYEDDRY